MAPPAAALHLATAATVRVRGPRLQDPQPRPYHGGREVAVQQGIHDGRRTRLAGPRHHFASLRSVGGVDLERRLVALSADPVVVVVAELEDLQVAGEGVDGLPRIEEVDLPAGDTGGAVFTFTLPVALVADLEIGAVPDPRPESRPDPRAQGAVE